MTKFVAARDYGPQPAPVAGVEPSVSENSVVLIGAGELDGERWTERRRRPRPPPLAQNITLPVIFASFPIPLRRLARAGVAQLV